MKTRYSFRRPPIGLLFFLLGFSIVVLLLGCSVGRRAKRPNVVLISIDTCRADHLGCYGSEKGASPSIDRFASEAVVFKNAVATAPITLPAHCSMLTGLIPPNHGTHDNVEYRLDEAKLTLAEILGEHGYATAAVLGSFVLDAQFGLEQGFQYYNDSKDFEKVNQDAADFFPERKGSEVTEVSCNWLEENGRKSNFFLFVHYYDPHSMYHPPEPFASRFPKDPYSGEIAYVDQCIETLFEKLKELGLWDSSLIVLTSDHGEGLGQHGEQTHAYFVYQSTLAVPLVIKRPKVSDSLTVDMAVSLVDIVPTILDVTNITGPERLDGVSLEPCFAEPSSRGIPKRAVFAESLYPTKYGCSPLFTAVTESWKYIESTKPELYSLKSDPDETENILSKHPEEVKRLRGFIEEQLADSTAPGSARHTPLDEESLRKLQALGYVTSRKVQESFDLSLGRPDAKDFIELHETLNKAQDLLNYKEFKKVTTVCEEALAKWPTVAEIHYMLGKASFEQANFQAAISHYGRFLETLGEETGQSETPAISDTALIKRDKNIAGVHNNLALSFLETDCPDKAIESFERALEFEPDNAGIYNNVGVIFLRQGQVDKAMSSFQKSLYFDPEFTHPRRKLARLLLSRRNFQDAKNHYSKLIEINPGDLEAQAGIGMCLANAGNYKEAVPLLRNSLEGQDNPEVRNVLARALILLGSIKEAENEYLHSIEQHPEYAESYSNLADLYALNGQTEKRIEILEQGVARHAENPILANNLAWVFATATQDSFRNGQAAIELATKASQLSGNRIWSVSDTLAAAFAETGRFERALEIVGPVKQNALKHDQGEVAEIMDARISLYQARRPLREDSTDVFTK